MTPDPSAIPTSRGPVGEPTAPRRGHAELHSAVTVERQQFAQRGGGGDVGWPAAGVSGLPATDD